jgi:hypothetical protein
MDAAGLQNLFSQGNPFLAQMGEQAWNQDQQKAQQALLAAQGQEQRAQAMQPLQEAHQRATTGYNQALTQQLTDKKAGELPANERMTLAMSEYRKKMSDAQAAEEDTKMQRRMQYAEMAAKNGGVLPLEYLNQLDASERGHFANPKAVATTQQLAKAWYDTHPKTIENRAKQKAEYDKAIDAARIMAENRLAVKKAASGAGTAKNMSAEQAMTHYNKLAMAESDPDLRAQYQAEADRNELIALRFRQASAQARGEQGLDIPATVAGGKPVNKPQTTPSPTPRDGGKPKPGSSPDNPIILK